MYWLVLCANFTQATVIREEGASGEEMPPCDPAVRHFLSYPSMARVEEGEAPIMVGAIPGLEVLGSIRKQAAQAL